MKQEIAGSGNTLAEALDDAIGKALAGLKKPDAIVKWKLLEVTGEFGGIASMNGVTVKIQYDG